LLALDFLEVPIVDSTTAKVLERFAHKLSHAGTLWVIAGAPRSVRRSLLRVGPRKPIVCYTRSAEEAVARSRAAAVDASSAE
jgi:anti-anti-sigma regulatory factor